MNKNLEVLYKENCQFHRDFIEWRYRIMLRYFVVTAALLFFAKWIWESDQAYIKNYIYVPFIISAALSMCFFVMDRRNIRIMDISESVGRQLEKDLYHQGGYFVGLLSAEIKKKQAFNFRFISYTFVLGFLYIGTCLASLLVAIYLMTIF